MSRRELFHHIRFNTREAESHPIPFNLMNAGTGIFDATSDAGPPKRYSARKDWFWTGVVVASAFWIVVIVASR